MSASDAFKSALIADYPKVPKCNSPCHADIIIIAYVQCKRHPTLNISENEPDNLVISPQFVWLLTPDVSTLLSR